MGHCGRDVVCPMHDLLRQRQEKIRHDVTGLEQERSFDLVSKRVAQTVPKSKMSFFC